MTEPMTNQETVPMHECPEEGCARVFASAQGLATHFTRTHSGRVWSSNPSGQGKPTTRMAKRLRSVGVADAHAAHDAIVTDVFARVFAATSALFPAGIPPEAVIPVAKWQETTLKMLASI